MRSIQILTGKRGLGHFARARELCRLMATLDDRRNPGEHLVVVSVDQARRYPGGLPSHYREVSDEAPLAAAELRTLIADVQPEVVFVDNRPEGPHDALLSLSPTAMRRASPRSRIVLATRDVLDSRKVMTKAWSSKAIRRLIDDYDDIWCFGDEEVFDIVSNYDLARAARYVGYLAAPPVVCEHQACATQLTVTAGGGVDSCWTINVVKALEHVTPLSTVRVAIGPHAPARVRAFMRSQVDRGLRVGEHLHGLSAEPACGHTVIGMGGYNTVAETVRSGRRLLAAPRTFPTSEQLIRAKAFARRGHAEILPVHDAARLVATLRSSLAGANGGAARGLPVKFADATALADAWRFVAIPGAILGQR